MTKKVLIVDDDKDVLEAMKFMFDSCNFHTITDTGKHVIQKVKKEKPDVILLDILLSGKNGIDMCKELKKDQVTKDIPVIMISAHANAASYVAICGAEDFIAKPFEIDALLSTVNKYANSVN